MKKPSVRIALVFFVVLTGINLFIFYRRDNFSYIPYKSYGSLYDSGDKDCERKWRQFIAQYPSEEQEKARKILSDNTHIDSVGSTIDKVLTIAAFEYQRFQGQMGQPSPALSGLSPLQQFKKVSSVKTERLWCGNLAAIFAFFCWSEGITCRYVEIFNPGNHHVVNECFIPELNQWVLVDVTTNNLLWHDEQSNFLNLQQAINRAINKNRIYSWRWKDSSATKTKLDLNEPAIATYYNRKNPTYYFSSLISESTYTPSEKIKRYFLPVSWYDVYEENKGSNLPFYAKIASFLLWILAAFSLAGLFLQNRKP